MVGFSGSLTHTITVPEVAWFLMGVVGLTVSWRNLVDCWRDGVALNFANKNGLLRLAAQASTREEAFRVVKCVIICIVGLAAMASPSSNPHQPISPLVVLVTVGIFLLCVVIVIGSIAANRTRREMRQHT